MECGATIAATGMNTDRILKLRTAPVFEPPMAWGWTPVAGGPNFWVYLAVWLLLEPTHAHRPQHNGGKDRSADDRGIFERGTKPESADVPFCSWDSFAAAYAIAHLC